MTVHTTMIRLRLAGLLAVASLAPAPALAQDVDPVRIDSIFAFANNKVPGCAVATIRNGTLAFARGYGIADLEHDVPIAPSTPFYMASVSKQFTAAAINLLAAEGRLSLDDDVRNFVPELPKYDAAITVRHLVNHTAGLRDYLSLFGLAGLGDFPVNNKDFLEMLGRQRALNFRTGEQYSYSNSGYVLLSIVVERVTGKSLRAFMQERFFEPLGMSSTVFRDRHNMIIKGRALAYFQNSGSWAHAVPAFDVVGDGGLFSTVEDLAKWERQMLEAEPRIGGPAWRTLTDQRGKLADGTTLTYGAGLIHDTYRGEQFVQHGGGYGGYSTFLLRLPQRRLSVAVLCNGGSNAGQLAQRVANLYLPPEPAAITQSTTPPAVTMTASQMAPLTGMFFAEREVLFREILVADGKMYYNRGGGNRSELAALGDGRFQMVGQPLVVAYTGRDTITLETADGRTTLYRVAAGRRVSRGYEGTYVSSDLPARWTVQVADSGLTITRPRGDAMRVDRAFDDAFRNPGLFVRFRRDATGAIVALEASAGERARHIRFDRQR
jgi:CubicO group peptidase (beta-lactamase class C family)